MSTRFFNIAHAITLTFSAYFSYLFFVQFQFSIWVAIPLAIVCATVVGILSEQILFKQLRRRNAPHMMLMICSLGLYTVLQNVILLIWGTGIKRIRPLEVEAGIVFLRAYVSNSKIVTIIVCLVLFFMCFIFLRFNRIGRSIRAVASNPDLCNIIGLSSDRTIFFAFGIGSFLVSIAGILIAYDTGIRATMGFSWVLYGAVAMIIGGIGSHWGLIGGALLLATAQHLAAYYIGSQWLDATAYIILILFLIAKPLGFSGKRLKKVEI